MQDSSPEDEATPPPPPKVAPPPRRHRSAFVGPFAIEFKDEDKTRPPQTLRRCGLVPDLYVTEKGEFFMLKQVGVVQAGPVTQVRWRDFSLNARQCVADAFVPEWRELNLALYPHNPDRPHDVSLDNLAYSEEPRRGRPPSSELQKMLRAYHYHAAGESAESIAEAVGLPVEKVLEAVRRIDVGREREVRLRQLHRVKDRK